MKKNILFVFIMMQVLFFLGCADNGQGNQTKIPNTSSIKNTIPPAATQRSTLSPTASDGSIPLPTPSGSGAALERVEDYYPIRPNTHYVYQGEGNEYASYDVYIDYTAPNNVQRRINNGGTVTAQVVSVENGKVTKIFSREEAYYRENFLQAKGGKEEVLLMEPLRIGTTWTLKDGRVRTITGTSVNVNTPSGDFIAIEVLTQGTNDKTIEYYARDIGLVETVFLVDDTKITSTLSEIEEEVPFKQTVRFFYPNSDSTSIVYVDKVITFHTNDVTRKTLESSYKDTPAQANKVFSPGTVINSLYLNPDGMVYIDLNQAFVMEMNAGSGYEQLILQSVADTFGYYYQTNRVRLTIDNKAYQSGHIILKKGEYLTAKPQEATAIP